MMKYPASTLAALLLAAVFRLPAAAQNVLDRCNAPIADVETMAARVTDCRAWIAEARRLEKTNHGPAGPATPAPVVPKQSPKPQPAPKPSFAPPKTPVVSQKPRTIPKPENTVPPIAPVVFISSVVIPNEISLALRAEPATITRLTLYFAYDAFVSGDVGRCGSMKVLNNSSLTCTEIVDDLSFVRSRVGPREEFIKGCMTRRDMAERDFSPEKLSEWCGLIADHAQEPAALCAKLIPMFGPVKSKHEGRPTVAECKATFSSLRGDDSSCGAFTPDRRPACQSDALFAKAFKAKNASLCAGNTRCRVLMGEGRAVLKEMEASFTTPAGKWAVKKGWNVKIRMPAPEQTPTKPIPTPSDPAVETPVTPVVPVPTPGKPPVPTPDEPRTPPAAASTSSTPKTPVPAPFKGFVCADPVWSESNRKAAADALKGAQLCLTDIESVAKPNPALTKGLDERLEQLARLTLKMNAAFDGSPAKKPAKAAPKQR